MTRPISQPSLFDMAPTVVPPPKWAREFDADRAEKGKERGIGRAEARNAKAIALAREIALEICRRCGTATTDDVRKEFERRNLKWIGSAAGAIFQDPRFEFAERYHKSTVTKGHGNLLRVWRERT